MQAKLAMRSAAAALLGALLLQLASAASVLESERAAVLRQYGHLQPEIDLWLQLGKPTELPFLDRGNTSYPGLLVEMPKRASLHAANYEKDVLYYLYTQENPVATRVEGNAEAFKKAGWKADRPTKIVIHGFTNNIHSDLFNTLVPNLLTADVNVVGVDWGALCPSPFYVTARSHVAGTGKQVALLVDALVADGGLNLAQLHILGHSLGGHVAANVGKNVNSGKIGRITGLDPAMPLFLVLNADRLSRGDAELVDVVHTCGGMLGLEQAIGDVDFYPNGGSRPQGGCGFDLTGSCSHARSYQYVAESAIEPEAFPAAECGSTNEAAGGACGDHYTGRMGVHLKFDPSGSRTYYLKTASSAPFDLAVHARVSDADV